MTKKYNGYAKWVIVAIAVLTLAFNSGILYNDVKHLTESIAKLEESHKSLNEKVDTLILSLTERDKE